MSGASTTCAKAPKCAGSTGISSNKIKHKSQSAIKVSLRSERDGPPVIIGFDAEWTEDPASDEGNVILSYQTSLLVEGHEPRNLMHWTRVGAQLRGWENATEQPERYRFGQLIALAIADGIKHGLLRKWPKAVIAAAHWTRADLSAMKDYDKIKQQFDGIAKSYITLLRPYRWRENVQKHRREFDVHLVDTQELVPATRKSLEALGSLHGVEKLDIGTTDDGIPYIAVMDELITDDPELYERYALRDAEISARHVQWMLQFQRDNGMSATKPPATLGTLAVNYLLNRWKEDGISADEVNGVTVTKQRCHVQESGKWYNKKLQEHHPNCEQWEPLSRNAVFTVAETNAFGSVRHRMALVRGASSTCPGLIRLRYPRCRCSTTTGRLR